VNMDMQSEATCASKDSGAKSADGADIAVK